MTARDPKVIQALFNEVSPTYDLLNRILSLGLDQRWRAAAAREAGEGQDGETRVDLCGGTGDLATALAVRFPRGRVVLVDFAEAMLRLAQRKRAGSGEGGRVHPVCADALTLPLPDQSCAAATAGFGVRNLADTRAGLAEAYRVLRPGGRVAILEFMRPQGPLAPLKRLLLRYGVPLIVLCVARRHAAAYRYLTESIVSYLSTDEMVAVLREVGFVDITVRHQPLGYASIIRGTRP
jgi:ubiquinone/menaquinone biosynthesis methyltransferase